MKYTLFLSPLILMLLVTTNTLDAHKKAESKKQEDSFFSKNSKYCSDYTDTINPNLTPLQFYKILLVIGVSGSVALQAYNYGYIDFSCCQNLSAKKIFAALTLVGLAGTLWNMPCDENENEEEPYNFYC